MPLKKHQVFVSSTFMDLHEERKRVIETLLMADCIPAGMEAFVATDDEQFSVVKRVIDLCDYYVLIIAKRYGSVNQATGLSYTEMEYDYAQSKQIPVLVFALDDNTDWPTNRTDSCPEQIEKLRLFKQKAMKNRLASVWEDTADLNRSVALSIVNAKTTFPRPGWQRAVDFDEVSLHRKIMDINEQNMELLQQVNQLKQELDAYTSPNDDLAFDNTPMEFYYHYYNATGERIIRRVVTTLVDLFQLFSLEMLCGAVAQNAIYEAFSSRFLKGFRSSMDDKQFVVRCLNQFRALGYLKITEDIGSAEIRWATTPQGAKVRDELTLIKKRS